MNSTIRSISFLCAGVAMAISILYTTTLQGERYLECDLSSPALHFENCVVQAEELLINPDRFHNKTVMVEGMFNWGTEDNYIITEGSHINGQVWVEYIPRFYDERGYEGQSRGIIKGVFDKNDDGHLGQHQGAIFSLGIVYEQ